MGLIFSVKGHMGIVWDIIAVYQDIGESPSRELHRVSMLVQKEAKLEQLQRGLAEWRLVYQQLQLSRRQYTKFAEKNLGFTAVLSG